MAIREFDAHRRRKEREEVRFRTRDGKKVDFMARKEKRVPVHVRFRTRDRSSR
jgi:hypothetical protein